jgi:hypothetical protein
MDGNVDIVKIEKVYILIMSFIKAKEGRMR